MEIRKSFKFEMAHIVRKAWSQRCSRNVHGHSYTVEFFFESPVLDDGQMVIDFGIIKKYFHDFVDSFDHSMWLWDIPEDKEIITFFKDNFERVIVTPFSSSAESQARMFFYFGESMLEKISNFMPEYEQVNLSRVRVHETTTGYGEYLYIDKDTLPLPKDSWYISKGIQNDWKEPDITRGVLQTLTPTPL